MEAKIDMHSHQTLEESWGAFDKIVKLLGYAHDTDMPNDAKAVIVDHCTRTAIIQASLLRAKWGLRIE